jgi:pantothenate kinase
MMPTPPTLTVAAAVARAAAMAESGERLILGIAGCPGGGKSTLAAQVIDALGPSLAVLVPMDGFHLANSTLVALDRRHRKGAPDTFDDVGYVALLSRLADRDRIGVVYAPEFRRDLGEPIAGAIAVSAAVPLIVTEGNYLLYGRGAWGDVAGWLHETWYVDVDDDLRLERLIARHIHFGKSPAEAHEWVMRSDQSNAALIGETRPRANYLVAVD